MAYALSYDKFDDPEHTLMARKGDGPKTRGAKVGAKKRRLKLCGFRTTYEVNAPTATATTTLGCAPTEDARDARLAKKTRQLDAFGVEEYVALADRRGAATRCWLCVGAALIVATILVVGAAVASSSGGAAAANKSAPDAPTGSSVGRRPHVDASLPSDYPGDGPVSDTPVSASVSPVSFDEAQNSAPKTARNFNDATTHANLTSGVDSHDSDMEYVTPMKNSPSLDVNDIIYDEIRNITQPFPHHSGHFRDDTAEVFDPHPKYVINATRKNMTLELTHNINFRPTHLRVVTVSNNLSRKHEDKNPACYYTGTVQGERNSHVGVSLCNGMTGYIKTAHGDYHIAPDEDYDPVKHSNTSIRHRLTKMTMTLEQGYPGDVHDNDEVISSRIDFEPLDGLAGHPRRKFLRRSTRSVYSDRPEEEGYEDDVVDHVYYYQHFGDDEQARPERNQFNLESNKPYYIATMVVADRKMAEYHKHEDHLTRYILTLMSHAALLFKDATVGNPIALVVVDIVILNHTDFAAPSSPEILRKFCEYQTRHSHKQHDVALLLTRDVICKNASVEVCTTLGVAEVGSMCNPSSSCAVVRDKGLSTSFTIAHELGHVLSMPHDDDRKCNKIHNGTTPNYIMARSLHHETQPWHWSQCSKHYLTEFLTSPRARCLLDEPHADHMRDNPLRPSASLLPGEAFQADKQCELEFGPGSRICSFMPKCSSLWCTHEFDTKPGDSGCKTQYMPWADGTPCGWNMWCLQGNCTSKNHFNPVHGGWGALRPRGNCTRPCGGGIQMSVRECNNPTPAHGGSYCMGPSHHYKSCNTHDCPKHTPDFRETQCAQFNGNSKGLIGLDHNVRWVPKYGTNREDACKLYCRVDMSSSYYLLESKVLDGTKCGLNSFDICVNGVCMKGGCDNRLASNVTLDDCGVCGGNNKECCSSSGFYNKTNYGYHQVIQIPKGSSNIVIRQRALDDESDENYLALREPPTTKNTNVYHLNGNSVISGYTKDIIYGGLTFKYSGSNNTEESIVTPPKAKLTKDIVVEVLQVGNVTHPNIEWSYTIACKDSPNYSWEYYKDKWTDCNSICHGYRYPLRKCKDLVKKTEVNPQFCDNLSRDNPKACNTHCELEWHVKHRGACSSYCGPGWRSLSYECVEIHVDSKEQRVIAKEHCRGKPAPAARERCDGTCESIRWQYEDWGHCSKTCGGGFQERRAVCVDDQGDVLDDVYCSRQEKHSTQACGEGTCPAWTYQDWSACSATCGSGIRRRQAVCRIGNRLVSHPYCPHPRPPVEESVCNEAPCHSPVWIFGDWNECGGECGDAYQRRLVTCTDAQLGGTLTDEHCANLPRPPDARQCDLHECAYDWVMSDWGKCSAPCGEGVQSRQVRCARKDAAGMRAEDDKYCEATSSRPSGTRKCNIAGCPVEKIGIKLRHSPSRSAHSNRIDTDGDYLYERQYAYRWMVQKHSTTECSTACGTGYKNRTVFCLGTAADGETYHFTDARCEGANLRRKPSTSIACKRYECSHAWIESNWSPCSVSCGAGVRSRQIVCNAVRRYPQLHFVTAESARCAMVGKPHEQERCAEMDCGDPYRWRKGEWAKCRSPCKDEKQLRKVFCVDRTNGKVPNHNCRQLRRTKPRRRRRCGNKSCANARTCRELQIVRGERRNNDYWLWIGDKRARIYCYKMDTERPEEFITLLDGESNYSEVYVRANAAGRGPTWGCSADVSDSLQRTKFWKLRLDINTMTIIADDFTHSRSRSNSNVPLGTAGDCFGRNCTRGQFKIDLTRTSFRLSSDNSWIPYGQSARKLVRTTSNTTISGRCGGGCGGCKFNPSVGIKVEIT